MPIRVEDLQELVRLLEQQPQWRDALRDVLWKDDDFVRWLRDRLPRLLQEDPQLGAQLVGFLAQTLSPRYELVRVLEEIRTLREDYGRRFEAMDRRFEAMEERFRVLQEDMDRRFQAMEERFRVLQEDMDRRFQAMEERFRALQEDMDRRFRLHAEILRQHGRELRYLRVGFGSLGRRLGLGFEEAVRGIVEEFTGLGPLRAERLVLRDDAGEVFGVPGQRVEFDAFLHDGERILVEVKAFAEREDVLVFRRKVEFAARRLNEPVRAVLVAPFAHPRAVETAQELGVQILTAEEEPAEPA